MRADLQVNYSNTNATYIYGGIGLGYTGFDILANFKAKTKVGVAGTFSNLRILVDTFTSSGAITLYKNGSATAVTVSVTGTGVFTDLSNSVSVAVGDEVWYQSTGQYAFTSLALGFNDNTPTGVSVFTSTPSTVFTYASDPSKTWFQAPTSAGGFNDSGIQKELVAATMPTGGSWKYMRCVVVTNTRTTTTTVRSRIGDSNGAQVLTITAGSTGTFEDLTHTDTLSAGNLIYYSIVTGASAAFQYIDMTITSTLIFSGNKAIYGHGSGTLTPDAIPASSTRYVKFNGLTPTTTESQTQTIIATTCTASNLLIRPRSMGSTATWTLRKNGSNTALVLTIPSGSSGYYTNTSDSVSLSPGDLVNYRVVTGSGSAASHSSVQTLLTFSNPPAGKAPLVWGVIS